MGELGPYITKKADDVCPAELRARGWAQTAVIRDGFLERQMWGREQD